jgi:riboflavin kinase/FMN adenylyltransferase
MKREYGLEQIEKTGGSLVTVGSFDGVHAGHQAIVRYVIRRAQKRHRSSVVVSFEPHPREVLSGHPVPLLTTVEERATYLEALGVDRFIVLSFTPDFAALSPEAFVMQVLVGRIGLEEIVVGYDHGFGRDREGDVALLQVLGRRHGFAVDVIPSQEVQRHVVSSTEIRRLLMEEGAVRQAAEMLGRRYALTGTVVQGDRRGHTIGYPTANIVVDHPRKVIPRRGVYAVQATPADDETMHSGMMNIGYRPTFDGDARLHLEVHLFDFDRVLYGRPLRVDFVERLRDEKKFDGIDALVAQLADDERRSRRMLEGSP